MLNVIVTAGIGLIGGLGVEAAKARGWLGWLAPTVSGDGAESETTRQVMGYVVAGEPTPLAVRVDRAVALVRGGQRDVVERNLRAVDPTARVIARVVLALPKFYWSDSSESAMPAASASAPGTTGHDGCGGPGHCDCDRCTHAAAPRAAAVAPTDECADDLPDDELDCADDLPGDELDCADDLPGDELDCADDLESNELEADDLDCADLPDCDSAADDDGRGWTKLLRPPACRTGCG